MSSLWQHWTVRELQRLLDGEDPDLLRSLERILPALLGRSFNRDSLYMRDSLVRVVEAFLPSDAFADRAFRARCLNLLPPEKLAECATAVGVGQTGKFADVLEAIAKKPWRDPFASSFIEHFSLPDHFRPAVPDTRGGHVDLEPPSPDTPVRVTSPLKLLKDYQFKVHSEACRRLETPFSRFVIQMPTGSGKTRTMMETVCHTLNEVDGGLVLWITDSPELCEQALVCFLEVWPHVARKPLRAHRTWDRYGLPELDDRRASFVVASFQKLHHALPKDPETLTRIKERLSLIVIDEAHRSEAPTYKKVIQDLVAEGTRVVGLTATPGRTDRDELEDLSKLFFNEKIGIPTPDHEGVVGMLRNRGVLSHAKYSPILTELDVTLSAKERKHLEEKLELPQSVSDRLGQDELRNVEIVKRALEEVNQGRQILLFACSVRHSRFLTSILLYLGVRAGHVDAETSSSRRQELIERFRRRELQVLANFGVLTTGFDAPKTDVVFITRPTGSPVLYSQMIGRGLRGPAIGGTAACTVVDVRDNLIEFGDAERVYEMFDDYWVN